MIERRLLAIGTAALLGISLSACTAASGPAVTVTAAPLPAATVTATPAPASGDTPLDSLGAWTACGGFLMTCASPGMKGALRPGQNGYSPDLVTRTGDSFKVQLVGKVGETRYYCTVSGTYGAPVIGDWIIQQ